MKNERYVRPSVAGWLLPTTAGTFIAAYGAVSLYAAIGPVPDLVPRSVFWVVGMALATGWSLVYLLVQSLVDLALLAVRVRTLVNGKAAWFSAIVAPLLPLATYAAYSPHKWWKLGPWAVIIALVAPMLVSAVAIRLFGAKKP
ncbi:MAG TPA: hypothetical protein VLM85_07930 [Polyangiaceae bacterium]|nr:hypothetical protein [Polyangiaceae bacterium]